MERANIKRLRSSRFNNALRVKSRADRLLESKYGSNGSSNRLFKQCKTYTHLKQEKEIEKLVDESLLYDRDAGFGTPRSMSTSIKFAELKDTGPRFTSA